MRLKCASFSQIDLKVAETFRRKGKGEGVVPAFPISLGFLFVMFFRKIEVYWNSNAGFWNEKQSEQFEPNFGKSIPTGSQFTCILHSKNYHQT